MHIKLLGVLVVNKCRTRYLSWFKHNTNFKPSHTYANARGASYYETADFYSSIATVHSSAPVAKRRYIALTLTVYATGLVELAL